MNKKYFWMAGILGILFCAQACAKPVTIVDSSGEKMVFDKSPGRVVSLVPSATEIIFALGAGEALKGLTHHSTNHREARGKAVVGGFFSPCLSAIEKLRPEVIILSPLHNDVAGHYAASDVKVVQVRTLKLSDSADTIRMMGRIFGKQSEAEELILRNRKELDLIREKVAGIPLNERKRVVRLMGREKVMVPGDDSFQNGLIAAAGGIAPKWGKKGNVVQVTAEEWRRFNPQVIYGCGGDRKAAKGFFSRPGWKDVDAVKNGQIFYFPCDLTCRAATHTGYFVSWLSSMLYTDAFAEGRNQVHTDRVIKSRPLTVDLPYVKDARIAYSTIYDFVNKTLIVEFNSPQKVVSTLEGEREGILSVGNHYSPPQCWRIGHKNGLNGVRDKVFSVTKRTGDTASFLYTGADMDRISIRKAVYRGMEVHALVTAGVRSNAVRMSRDLGNYYEPGTINILIMTNMQLTSRAMTRAIISATEAKTAALMDMDVRSSYLPGRYRATGTGTDNIIVVQGSSLASTMGIDNAGGHSKMGELIATAVHEGVKEAVLKQNGIYPSRDIFQRLSERRISVHQLVTGARCGCDEIRSEFSAAVEETLLNPRYAAFIESAMSMSDSYEKGLITDLSAFETWCRSIAEDIAGKRIDTLEQLIPEEQAPLVLRTALDAVLNGVRANIKRI